MDELSKIQADLITNFKPGTKFVYRPAGLPLDDIHRGPKEAEFVSYGEKMEDGRFMIAKVQNKGENKGLSPGKFYLTCVHESQVEYSLNGHIVRIKD